MRETGESACSGQTMRCGNQSLSAFIPHYLDAGTSVVSTGVALHPACTSMANSIQAIESASLSTPNLHRVVAVSSC